MISSTPKRKRLMVITLTLSLLLLSVSGCSTNRIVKSAPAVEKQRELFNKAWPPLKIDGSWVRYSKDNVTVDYYEETTLQRYDNYRGVWIRGDMLPESLQQARRLMEKDKGNSTTQILMEQTYMYGYIDCENNLYKPRAMKIFTDGTLVFSPSFDNENPNDWTQIPEDDISMNSLIKILCSPK